MKPAVRGWSKLGIGAAALAIAFSLPGAEAIPVALDAKVVKIKRSSKILTFPSVSYRGGDSHKGKTNWRVVEGIGNCCELYLTSTPQGRLLDFGGTYVRYTDDNGKTWSQVEPTEKLMNGEGTIAVAPGGDIIGVQWDPYSGDHLLSFKYEAKSKKWKYTELPIHEPFFDREWVAALPGPFTNGIDKAPYITFMHGGGFFRQLWMYSFDGLNYQWFSNSQLDTRRDNKIRKKLNVVAAPQNDWIQPHTSSLLVPVGGGQALAGVDDNWLILDKNLRWHRFKFPGGGTPSGLFQVDSKGRLHNLIALGDRFEYRISDNDGRTWTKTTVKLPSGHTIGECVGSFIDFKANRSVGIAAVALQARNTKTTKTQDMVYKLDIRGDQARVIERLELGRGDVTPACGLNVQHYVQPAPRMDFQSISILPDGRVAAAFMDSTTTFVHPVRGTVQPAPALAIEVK